MDKKRISSDEVKRSIDEFAVKERVFLSGIDIVVGISRGGLVPAALLAAKIDKPLVAAYIKITDIQIADMSLMNGARVGIAAQAIGIARASFEEALRYAQDRKTFGQPIANHQAIQFMLADMATEIDAARLLTLKAAAMKDQGVRHSAESSMAKLYASEMASRVANKGLQIHGGQGYSKEFDAERHVRDARITEIYEGTSEIQRIVISGALFKE